MKRTEPVRYFVTFCGVCILLGENTCAYCDQAEEYAEKEEAVMSVPHILTSTDMQEAPNHLISPLSQGLARSCGGPGMSVGAIVAEPLSTDGAPRTRLSGFGAHELLKFYENTP